ncbi:MULTISPECIES: hypothetical protein [Staphylococcus]|uniref:Uncharacterized protein n=1 Tax=Staphylococcus aureus TaxID=1280 RepID=A0A6B3J562_STAAU|nr:MULTISPECIES: hypothetical protein [Staphylococcus]MDR7679554.1 hypothetical protein [Staphylococcus argenteus]NDP69062.1 hypothetical protein [Staphylococcus aureus]NDP74273.1 hypothetical protein [Staphylococcus aureus]NDR02604.1 hypothetical protein [Staphylococcus aureus]NDR07345.1 hypothetical protein [Staphylococcus aureus]
MEHNKTTTEIVLEKRLMEEMNKSITLEMQLIEQSKVIEELKSKMKENKN